jgi:hypothetical protein
MGNNVQGEQPPKESDIADGGNLLIATQGAVVMLATKRGGMLVSEPQWIKMNLWQFVAIIGMFLKAYSEGQLESLTKMLSVGAGGSPFKPN